MLFVSAGGAKTEGCGSCYGAGGEGVCCNTCEEVREVYKKKGCVASNGTGIMPTILILFGCGYGNAHARVGVYPCTCLPLTSSLRSCTANVNVSLLHACLEPMLSLRRWQFNMAGVEQCSREGFYGDVMEQLNAGE